MTAAVAINDRLLGVIAHPAGAEHVGRTERSHRSRTLWRFFHPPGEQDPRVVLAMKAKGQFRLVQITMNAGERDAEFVPLVRIEIDVRVDVWERLADRFERQRPTEDAPHFRLGEPFPNLERRAWHN